MAKIVKTYWGRLTVARRGHAGTTAFGDNRLGLELYGNGNVDLYCRRKDAEQSCGAGLGESPIKLRVTIEEV